MFYDFVSGIETNRNENKDAKQVRKSAAGENSLPYRGDTVVTYHHVATVTKISKPLLERRVISAQFCGGAVSSVVGRENSAR